MKKRPWEIPCAALMPPHYLTGNVQLRLMYVISFCHRGVFDRNQESNAFRSYTVVNVLYCSGDIHGGNVVQDYVDSNGEPVQQKGLVNAQSALDWVANQQHNGNLSAELTSLVRTLAKQI